MNEIYLDHAATSHPKPDLVVKAVMRALTEENANPGRSGYERAINASGRIMEARNLIKKVLGARDEFEIIFTHNCTEALNLAIKGVLTKGSHVISSSLEHNSVLRVLGEMEKRGEIEWTVVEPESGGYIDPKSYIKALRKNTYLLILTHASNVTGAIQPLEAVGKIAKDAGVYYLVDGAQAAGETETDVLKYNCSFYAFAGHKGMLGPQGTGGLYIKKGIRINTIKEGGTGSSSESVLQPEEIPERYEAGTMNLPGLMGLKEGAEYVLANKDKIIGNIRMLTDALYEGLKGIKGVTLYTPPNPDFRTGVVSFNVNDLNSQETAEYLSMHGFSVRSGLHCAPFAHRWLKTLDRGAVRASVGYSNTMHEIDLFLESVYMLSKLQGPAF